MIFRLSAILSGCFVVLLALTLVVSPILPRGQQLAYVSECNGWENIMLMDLAHGLSECITNSRSAKDQLTWSADGEMLAYYNYGSAAFSIKLLQVRTGKERGFVLDDLYANDQQPLSWSPDSTKLAFVAFPPGATSDIFTIDVQSGEIAQVTDDLSDNARPNWSPSAPDELAYTRLGDGVYHIYVIDPSDPDFPLFVGTSVNMEWGMDGSQIIHSRWSNVVTVRKGEMRPREIMLPGTPRFNVVVAPDDIHMAMTLNHETGMDLYVVDLETGEAVPFTSDKTYEGQPAWSADSQWIAYVANKFNNEDIMLYHVATGVTQQMTRNRVRDASPVWRP